MFGIQQFTNRDLEASITDVPWALRVEREVPCQANRLGQTERDSMIPRPFPIALCAWLLIATLAAVAQVPRAPDKTDLATLHEEVGRLDCKDCHGATKPKAQVAEAALQTANQSCMRCHGSMENVAAKLAPRLANRHINPHASHVVSIQCVTCHVAHDAPSQAYCLQCHSFDMPMKLGRQLGTP